MPAVGDSPDDQPTEIVGSETSSSRVRFESLSLGHRLAFFAALFAAEWIPITALVHMRRPAAGILLHLAVVSGSIFLAIAYPKAKRTFQRISKELAAAPIAWGFLVGHVVALLAFIALSVAPPIPLPPGVNIGLWYATACLAVVLAACVFIPPSLAVRLVRSTGYAWFYAAIGGLISFRITTFFSIGNGAVWDPSSTLSWKPAIDLTFDLVHAFLKALLPVVVADKATLTLGGPHFKVMILPWCAGFEGTALMLVFGITWLVFFRREFRFPRALLLIPAGMAVMWLSNAVRLTALILIGVAGAPRVAMGGFHSQAGWIAFNCVALGFAILSRRMAWFRIGTERRAHSADTHNPTAAYLAPLLTILAAAMLSRAASGAVEWLYPLRFIAALIALWFFRSKYSQLNWHFGWFSVVAGVGVFAIWMGLDKLAGHPADSGIAPGLASVPQSARITWIVFRAVASIVTVPIAEELAFRGYLIRRWISAGFESLGAREYSWIAVLVSSIAFGLMHGGQWIAGTIAGLIYAFAFLRRGRIGDAVVAHATTNALLAAVVLLGGQWHLW